MKVLHKADKSYLYSTLNALQHENNPVPSARPRLRHLHTPGCGLYDRYGRKTHHRTGRPAGRRGISRIWINLSLDVSDPLLPDISRSVLYHPE